MRQLLYVSNTAYEFGLDDLDNVLAASRRNNAMLGITGLLLFIDGGFLQILEGEERAVLTSLSAKSRATLTVWRGDFEDEIYRVR